MSGFAYLIPHNPINRGSNERAWAILDNQYAWLERHCGNEYQQHIQEGGWYHTASNHFRFRHSTDALAFVRHFGARPTLPHIVVVPVDNNYLAAGWSNAELGLPATHTWLMESSVFWFASEPHAIECALRFR